MLLVGVSIQNYRSIIDAKNLSLSQKTVLIGPNNEGKSNILRAISVAMRAIERTDLHRTRVLISSRYNSHRRNNAEENFDWDRDFSIAKTKNTNKKSIQKTSITLEFQLNDEEIREFRSEIKSTINGSIPVCVTFFRDRKIKVQILKRGIGGNALNAKSEKIRKFLAERIEFNYIPAVRTAQSATLAVENLVAGELSALEEEESFRSALAQISALQKPLLDSLSARVTKTLKLFLQDVKSVKFSVDDEERFTALRRSVRITVDDGHPTSLEAKGDGVQSLVALGMRRHATATTNTSRSYIFAIEEPEAHLHPNAIHVLKNTIDEISNKDQVIITTHSPIFVDRANIGRNIIVQKSKAAASRNLSDIRLCLGIKSFDNLQNAEIALVVEGEDDRISLTPIICSMSQKIKDAFGSGRLIVESLNGASKLTNKLSNLKSFLCDYYCFLDNDSAGKSAADVAVKNSLLGIKDHSFAAMQGKSESELEDLFKKSIYAKAVQDNFGVDILSVMPSNRKDKWSARMENVFLKSGKPWNEAIKSQIKLHVAHCVADAPHDCIIDLGRGVIETMVKGIEAKLGG